MDKLKQFKDLGLSDNLIKTLYEKGFEVPSPIQTMTIPLILKGDCDIVGQAQTGTGKTAAFGLPLIDMIAEKQKKVQVLILAPTRELANQIADDLNSFKGSKKIHIVPIYGGQSIEQQMKRLASGVDIVVGTPGRIHDLLNRKSLKLDQIDYLVLDEADEMLKMGFIDEVELILSKTNEKKLTLMFCATMPTEILKLAQRFMGNYKLVKVEADQATTGLTDQIYFEVEEKDKFEALCRIIDFEIDFYGIIFCRTKIDVDHITSHLVDRGYDAESIHGDITQSQREKVLSKFKNKKITILVATDVAARGIDINNLSHVINYSLPQDVESYVHRVGRTGRAGNEGTAITFVTRRESWSLTQIRKKSKSDIRKGSIPGISEIISSKKKWIKNEITGMAEQELEKVYKKLAKEIIGESDPEDIVAALLKYSFSNDLDASGYKEISDKPKINEQTRLFIAKGARDGMNKRDIVELIKQKAKTHDKKINDVQVFDTYSFITVPFQEAEIILNVFRHSKPGRRALIEKADARK